MVVRLAASSNIDRWLTQWRKRVSELNKKASLTPRQAAEYGAKFAKTMAPRDTGALIQAIGWKVANAEKGKKGSGEAQIIVRNSPLNPKRSGKHARPSYYALQHNTHPSGWKYQNETGVKRYLNVAAKRTRKKFKVDVAKVYQNFVTNK